jgi:hypothetical protein
MKKIMIFSLVAVCIVSVSESCHKYGSSGYLSFGPNSLWPLVPGNSWAYKDSVFSDSSLITAYPDTAFVTSNTLKDNAGATYFEINNPNGWFVGSYVTVDPMNTTIYEADSPALQPYIFFQTAQQDGQVIGTGNDFSNPACPLQSTQYGFATMVNVQGHNCYQNIEYVTDCNNITREGIVTYISPGIGVVRIEDYIADTLHNNQLYLDYSQTLVGQTLK